MYYHNDHEIDGIGNKPNNNWELRILSFDQGYGEVMSLDFTGRYNNWDSVDPVELFTCPTEKKEATPKLKMPAFLSQEAKGCNYLVLWLDCDKEGENICFEVINEVEPVMGYISYPRTETTQYPENFDIIGVLKQFRQSAEFGADVRDVLSQGSVHPRKGQDVGDHPPITPMTLASRESFDHDSWRLYDYIVRHFIGSIDPQLVLPTMRSAVEEQLNLIAKGRGNYDEILRHALEIFRLKFIYFVQHIEGMDHLFEDTFSTLSQTGRNFSRCGACRRFMKLVASKPARLHCPNCDATYSLPAGGSFKLFNELKCPLDEFELLLWVGGPNGKGYPFCPYCYVFPPFREMKKGSGCNQCTHPSCTYGLNATGVASCGECPNGILVLDPTSGPKWQLACNQCQVVIKVCEDANKLSVASSTCPECDARQINVEYRPVNS
nr:EOG090X00WU [Daphnia pulex]